MRGRKRERYVRPAKDAKHEMRVLVNIRHATTMCAKVLEGIWVGASDRVRGSVMLCAVDGVATGEAMGESGGTRERRRSWVVQAVKGQ